MKLHSLKIEGFRRHQNTELLCSDATFLIGANNVGKSSVIKAIEYLLNDNPKISEDDFYCILNEEGDNERISEEVVLTAEFRNVPSKAKDWQGFNSQRLFEYKTDVDSGLCIFYRKTFSLGKKVTIEMKQYNSILKEKFKGAKTIQDYIDFGVSEDIVKEHFEDKTNKQKMTKKMLEKFQDIGVEDLFDVNEQEVIWFENPGGIPGNVTSRLPKFLLIPDMAESEELSGNRGALMKTLNSLFEDVRDASHNFKQAQYYLTELEKELDPEDDESDFAQLLYDLNRVVGDVFPSTSFLARANLSDPDKVIVPKFDVQLGSNINTTIDYQGAGVIRSAIFAMLRYRSIRENKKRVANEYVRPLLIAFEEPEIYLHPQAAQQMRDTIYDLSTDINNQIICTTHSPYMIDLSKSANQILNSLYIGESVVGRDSMDSKYEMICSNSFNVSKAFRNLVADDKSYVKMLLKIDDSIAKVFFTQNVLIVEGDTEEVVLRESISRMPNDMYKEFSYNWEIVRARGKGTIISLVKYLKALGINPYVIHDRDSGTKAFEMNKHIADAVDDGTRVVVLEECIEDLLGYEAPSNNKPYKAYQHIDEHSEKEWEGINAQWRRIIEGIMYGINDNPVQQKEYVAIKE